MDQLALTLVIVGSASVGVAALVYWLRSQVDHEKGLRDQPAKVAKHRSQNPTRRLRPPPPPTPDLVSIQQLWRASSTEDPDDPNTAVSSPGNIELPLNIDELAEPPTFPSNPGMNAFLEEEIASLPPRRRSRQADAPYPEAVGPADDFVKATKGVIRRSDKPHGTGGPTD